MLECVIVWRWRVIANIPRLVALLGERGVLDAAAISDE